MLKIVRKSLEIVLGLCYNSGRNKERVKNMNRADEPCNTQGFWVLFIFFL